MQYSPSIAYLSNLNLSEATGYRFMLGLEWKKNLHGIMPTLGFYESCFMLNDQRYKSSKTTLGVAYKYYTFESNNWLWSLNSRLDVSGFKIYEDTGIYIGPGVIKNELEMLVSAGTEIRFRVAYFSLGLGSDFVISLTNKNPSAPNPAMLVPYISLNLQLK
jgi:hypothetical protein